jgi:hypothetical protein
MRRPRTARRLRRFRHVVEGDGRSAQDL